MADNVAITAGAGTTIAADDVGGVLHQRVKVSVGVDGAAADMTAAAGAVGASTPRVTLASDDPAVVSLAAILLASAAAARLIVAVATTLTRPANVTAYTALDSISDNATAGSVTALPVTVSSTNDAPIRIDKIGVVTTDTGLAGKSIAVHVFNSDPTASSGVGAGDNAAWSNKKAGYLGRFSGSFRTLSDGAHATLVPDEGSSLICLPGSGAKTLWIQFQTLNDFTPSANSTTLIATLRGVQGIA